MQAELFEESRQLPHARATDPQSSHRSAVAIEAAEGTTTTFRPRTAKHEALKVFVAQNATARAVVLLTGRDGIWKRVSDLKNAKVIEKVGDTYDHLTRREVDLLGITALGRSVAARLEAGEVVVL